MRCVRTSFFGEVQRIGTSNYVPTETDVLRARAKSTGITETRFNMGQLSLVPIHSLRRLCSRLLKDTHVRCRRTEIGKKEMDSLFRERDEYHILYGVIGV